MTGLSSTRKVCNVMLRGVRSWALPVLAAIVLSLPALSSTLYLATGGGASSQQQLYTADKTNAHLTFVVALTDGGDANGDVIAFNPVDGLMYHWTSDTAPPYTESVNLTTLALTPITTSGASLSAFEIFGAVWDAANQRFLLVDIDQNLFADTPSGVFTLLGTMNPSSPAYRGLAFVNGTLYSADKNSDNLYTIDPASQTAQSVATVTMSGDPVHGIVSLATDPDTGLLWAIVTSGSMTNTTPRNLGTINPATGVFTSVGTVPGTSSSIAFAGADPFLYSSWWWWYVI